MASRERPRTVLPFWSVKTMVPEAEVLVPMGLLEGRTTLVMFEMEKELRGQGGIANETGMLTTGIVKVQLAPQAGHVATKGITLSTFILIAILPDEIFSLRDTE